MSPSPARLYFYADGQIVRARVTPPNNQGEIKVRPCVVINLDSDDPDFDPDIVVVVACSSKYSRRVPPVPTADEIPIPVDQNTQLDKPSAAVCFWVREIKKSDVVEVLGIIEPQLFLAIRAKVLDNLHRIQ